MTITVQQTPWVELRPGDVGFQLQGDVAVTGRAAIEIPKTCPLYYADVIAWAVEQQWIQPVASVPRTDPTLIWETLQQ
jgi:hypothetical protein